MSTYESLSDLRQRLRQSIDLIDALLATEPPVEVTHNHPAPVADRIAFISQHAIDRWKERTGSTKSDEQVLSKIAKLMQTADECELKPQHRLREALAHGIHAKYYRGGGMMFVVRDEVLITCHTGTADRWLKKAQPMTPNTMTQEEKRVAVATKGVLKL